jgi:hypothetical protein
MPPDPNPETALLGAILLTEEALLAATVVGVQPHHFTLDERHGWIYRAAHLLRITGQAVNVVTVASCLRDLGQGIHGQHLVDLLCICPAASAHHVADYATIVRSNPAAASSEPMAEETFDRLVEYLLAEARPDRYIADADGSAPWMATPAEQLVALAEIDPSLDAHLVRG